MKTCWKFLKSLTEKKDFHRHKNQMFFVLRRYDLYPCIRIFITRIREICRNNILLHNGFPSILNLKTKTEVFVILINMSLLYSDVHASSTSYVIFINWNWRICYNMKNTLLPYKAGDRRSNFKYAVFKIANLLGSTSCRWHTGSLLTLYCDVVDRRSLVLFRNRLHTALFKLA